MNKNVKECPVCGREFVKRHRQMYCSLQCLRKAQKRYIDTSPSLPPPKKPRRCLKCDQVFASSGPDNRICPACKQVNRAWLANNSEECKFLAAIL